MHEMWFGKLLTPAARVGKWLVPGVTLPLLWIMVAVAYLAFAEFGVSVPWVREGISPVWPPAGIAMSAILLLGRRVWPGIMLGEFAALIVLLHYPPLPALGISLGNSLEALCGVYLFRRSGGRTEFLESPQDVVKFVLLAGIVASAIGASIGVSNLILGGIVSSAELAGFWMIWWLGDAIGVIVLAPAVVSWFRGPWRPPGVRIAIEATLLLVLVSLMSIAIFWGYLPLGREHYPIEFILLPPLILAAMGFGSRGSTTSLLLVLVIAILGTAHGFGPFAGRPSAISLVLLQIFIGVNAVSILLFVSVVNQKKEAKRCLASSNEELLKANIHLKEIDLIKSHLLSGFSHEIKTPITLLMAYSEMIGEKYPEEELLVGLQDGSRRLSNQLNRILDYNALLGNSLVLFKTEVVLTEAFEQVVNLRSKELSLAGLHFCVGVDPDTPPIKADSRRINQILLELVDNAQKFTQPGGSVLLRAGPSGGLVQMSVCNTGQGIPEKSRVRIWEPTAQLEIGDSARRGGLGLGLTIVKMLTDLHGGTVAVEDNPQGGICFSVYLPVGVEPRSKEVA